MDITDILDWYNAQSPDLGDEFIQVFNRAIDLILDHPLAAPLVYRRARRLVIDRFPYSVFYIYERNRARVIAVMHHRRDPRDWQSRLP